MDGELGFIGGVLTGAAGSLHCVGLCGGIASSLLLAAGPAGGWRERARACALLQLGRVATYAAFGALAGAGGGALGLLLKAAGAQEILRGLAAASLVLAGLSVAGDRPALGRRIFSGHSPARTGCGSRRAGGPSPLPFALGLAWGLAPCGMVYSALLTAAFTGSPLGGAVFMLGFGTATLPALLCALFGTASLAARYRSASRAARVPLGGAMAALGLLSLCEPARRIGALCIGG